MTFEELKKAAIEIWGEHGWQINLARSLGLRRTTIWRWRQDNRVPGPVTAAVFAWRQNYRLTGKRPPRLEILP
jgi:hypothetical protein